MKDWHDNLVLRLRGQRLDDPQLIVFNKLDLAPITTSGKGKIPEYP